MEVLVAISLLISIIIGLSITNVLKIVYLLSADADPQIPLPVSSKLNSTLYPPSFNICKSSFI